ncbi:MAG: glutamine-hydrolyzing GMP synthase, partial [Gammaproteobacteria bacterium]|nr:glutamine-hydrolyzing GMP synthase [Gammaproteobacteria bacterium]
MSLPAAGIATAADEAVSHRILILDFGAQYTQLIARRVREAGVYSEILPWDVDQTLIKEFAPNGIVLAGGPESVILDNPPCVPELVFELGVPLLGICYGMQTMAAQLGGEVESSSEREFGYAQVTVTESSCLLDGLQGADAALNVWMSHGDRVTSLPDGFTAIASSANAPV